MPSLGWALVVVCMAVGAIPALGQCAEEQKLIAADIDANDEFGRSVSVSGDTAVVGAYGHDVAGSVFGSAYVYLRSGGVWTQQHNLTALDAETGDGLGVSVSVSDETAVVGAWDDDDAGTSSGSAYVFVRAGAVWTQQQKLTASDAAAGDLFGVSVSVSGDTAVVGAYGDDDAGLVSGSAYVYVRCGEAWIQQQKLTASDGAASDFFGISVCVSGDTAVVGAELDDGAVSDSGSAYVYVRSGGVWTEQQKLTAADAAAGDQFGISVSVSEDTAAVGAVGDDSAGSFSGSAYVFVRSGGVWTQQQKLTASDAAAGDQFGVRVSVDGDTAVVGAPRDGDAGDDSGSAYVYVRSGGVWNQQPKLTASNAAADDFFGISVSVNGDTAFVGAHYNDDAGSLSGSAYAFSCGSECAPDLNRDGVADILDFGVFQSLFDDCR
ncbi:MAG: hypothetical protein HOP29_18565 [Phycisphaerales bacterium]|nr:hypothetical protein [Phycisphaerales bacterium]